MMSAQATQTALDLPALGGSEKQVTWAATIRAEKLAQALRCIDQQAALARADGLSGAEITTAIDGARAIIQDTLSQRAHAGWWIDGRAQGALRTFELD